MKNKKNPCKWLHYCDVSVFVFESYIVTTRLHTWRCHMDINWFSFQAKNFGILWKQIRQIYLKSMALLEFKRWDFYSLFFFFFWYSYTQPTHIQLLYSNCVVLHLILIELNLDRSALYFFLLNIIVIPITIHSWYKTKDLSSTEFSGVSVNVFQVLF